MPESADLLARLRFEGGQFVSGMRDATSALGRFGAQSVLGVRAGTQFGGVLGSIGAQAAAGILPLLGWTGAVGTAVLAARSGIREFADMETSMLRLRLATGDNAAEFDRLAQAIERAPRGLIFDDNDVARAASMARFLDLTADEIIKLMPVMRGMAAIQKQDLTEAISSVAFALETGQVRALRQYGISLKDAERAARAAFGAPLKDLDEAERRIAVFNAIMEKAAFFTNAEKEAVQTLDGAARALGTTIGELSEDTMVPFGGILTDILNTINKTIEAGAKYPGIRGIRGRENLTPLFGESAIDLVKEWIAAQEEAKRVAEAATRSVTLTEAENVRARGAHEVAIKAEAEAIKKTKDVAAASVGTTVEAIAADKAHAKELQKKASLLEITVEQLNKYTEAQKKAAAAARAAREALEARFEEAVLRRVPGPREGLPERVREALPPEVPQAQRFGRQTRPSPFAVEAAGGRGVEALIAREVEAERSALAEREQLHDRFQGRREEIAALAGERAFERRRLEVRSEADITREILDIEKELKDVAAAGDVERAKVLNDQLKRLDQDKNDEDVRREQERIAIMEASFGAFFRSFETASLSFFRREQGRVKDWAMIGIGSAKMFGAALIREAIAKPAEKFAAFYFAQALGLEAILKAIPGSAALAAAKFAAIALAANLTASAIEASAERALTNEPGAFGQEPGRVPGTAREDRRVLGVTMTRPIENLTLNSVVTIQTQNAFFGNDGATAIEDLFQRYILEYMQRAMEAGRLSESGTR